jgi:hypothetical protein
MSCGGPAKLYVCFTYASTHAWMLGPSMLFPVVGTITYLV